ncbi:hypothetical protein [Streptomyces sp. NBC_01304]|uniref:hypothetical protein n=1 Tax=Streptomyces sp. NBC_01304 TaxID=2903818 RepID=UPI002E0E37E7|nr:hypothetical protein OG430_46100 [Streptomyces sp. NBC_01304]
MTGNLQLTDVQRKLYAHTSAPPVRSAARRPGIRAAGALVAALLLGSAAACSSPDPPDPPRAGTSATRPTPSPSAEAPTATDRSEAPDEAALPEILVGAWESNPPKGTASITYRFTADGRYMYVGLLFVANGEGDVAQATFVAEGTARVEGDALLLTPVTATRSLHDPTNPAGDYTDRPSDLTPTRHLWEVADDMLALTDAQGAQIVFERQSL